METAVFILQNSILILNTYLLVKNYFIFEDFFSNILSFFVLFYAQITLILASLGIFNLLYLRNILLLESFILLTTIVITKFRIFNIRKDIVNAGVRLEYLSLDNNVIRLCFAFIIGFALVKIAINLVNPPFGWDDLNYHFTFPVEWLKNGNLNNPIIVNDYPAPSYYPVNGSLLFFWLLAPFKNVFLADLGQTPFFIISFLAILAICRKLKISRIYSLFAAISLTITPNYFKQLKIAYVDVMVAALFLVGLNFLLDFYEKYNLKSLLLSAISVGLLVGTKLITLPHASIVFVFLLFMVLTKIHKIGIKKAVLSVALFLTFIFLFGGFSYFRNFILTGNFFYPLDIKLFGFNVLKGVMKTGFLNSANNDLGWGNLLFHEGVGAGFILFAIPGVVLSTAKILSRKNIDPKIYYLFALIPLLYLSYRFLVGLPIVRYIYPWFAVCYIVAFWGIDRFKVPLKIASPLIVICLIASIFEFSRHLELVSAIILSIFLFFTLPYFKKGICYFFRRPNAGIIFLLLCSVPLQFLYLEYSKNEFVRYRTSRKNSGFWPDAIEAWIWLDKNTFGNNIAYVGRPVPFPLYGSLLKNNVFYVSVNEKPPYLHAYKNACYVSDSDYEHFHKALMEPNNYRGNADYSVWLKNLRAKKSDYLFIYSLHQTKDIIFPIEDDWAKSHTDRFKSVFSNDTIHIYKITK